MFTQPYRPRCLFTQTHRRLRLPVEDSYQWSAIEEAVEENRDRGERRWSRAAIEEVVEERRDRGRGGAEPRKRRRCRRAAVEAVGWWGADREGEPRWRC
ncbi:hypothetical protein R6Q59_011018 [Mikania micrantha]